MTACCVYFLLKCIVVDPSIHPSTPNLGCSRQSESRRRNPTMSGRLSLCRASIHLFLVGFSRMSKYSWFFCYFDSKVLISGKSKEAAFVIVTQTTAKFDFSICLISYFSIFFASPHAHWNKSPSSPVFVRFWVDGFSFFSFFFFFFISSFSSNSDALSPPYGCIPWRMDCRRMRRIEKKRKVLPLNCVVALDLVSQLK